MYSKIPKKVYVSVMLNISENGNKIPVSVYFENGITYLVEKIVKIEKYFATREGTLSCRYSVIIRGHHTYLYEEGNGRWYVERKSPVLDNY